MQNGAQKAWENRKAGRTLSAKLPLACVVSKPNGRGSQGSGGYNQARMPHASAKLVRSALTRWRCALVLSTVAMSTVALDAGHLALKAEETGSSIFASKRSYTEGPLTGADYRARTPDPLPEADGTRMIANSHVEILFHYHCVWTSDRRGVHASIARFDCRACIDPAKSWITSAENSRLMDHEQGHFDIAELVAREARLEFARRMADKPLAGEGPTVAAALKLLNDKATAKMQVFLDRHMRLQREYDQITRHGLNPKVQAEERRKQKQQLSENSRD
jgi:hypothetical protein